jgi:hypothetical protein
MKRVITTIALLMSLAATLYAQLPTFEWRLENEQLTGPTTYQFDVNIYNTGSTAFEMRGGTIAFMIDTAWSRRGTLTVTTPSSGLVAGQQGAAVGFVNQTATAAAYFRKIIATVGATVGTTIPANSMVKCFTFVLTNTVAFSTTVPPRFAWKYTSTAPAAGFNYTDGLGNSATVVSNAQGSNPITVITNQAFCYTPIYWNGTIWRTANQTTNASVTPTPSATLDAVVFNGTVADGFNCRHYNLLSTRTHTLNSGILNIAGNATINGTLSSASGTINLNGSAFTANQTLSGSLSSLSVANLGFGLASNAGTKTISVPAIVTGAVTQSGTATLAATGGLTLKSSSTSTARIAALSSGSAITGTITAERFIPANGRRWRFLSSPVVGGTSLQWRDNGGNTSGRGTQITGSTVNDDVSTKNQASAYKYNESSSNGAADIDKKWETIDGNTSLVNGNGYRVFIRGDRSISLSVANATNNVTTLWVSGSNPSSPVSLPVTYNPTLGNGWNLVGNPFPSPIDWNANSGWTKTNISNTIWIWNPLNNSYGSFDGTTNTNAVTRYIASGQAFFVRANGLNPLLSAGESVKVGNTPSNMFKTPENNSLRIKLSTVLYESNQSDETVVRFMDGKSDNFDNYEDVSKPFMNPEVNVSSFFGQDKYAMVNYLDTKSINAKIVPLSAWVVSEGIYTMSFSQIDGFNSDINIYLKDNYKNTITDLRVNDTYAFNVDAQKESTQDGRLELIFVNKTSSVESVLAGRKASLNVYPNPAIDVLNIEVLNANFKNSVVTIYNVSGVEVMSVDMIGNKKSLDIEKLTSGAYLVKVSNTENGYTNTVKFIK